MTRFRKRRKTVVVSFAEHEADILANLLRNLVELLYDGLPPRATESSDPLAALLDSDGPTSPPEDVVLQRLLPDAYQQDDMAAAEFRRFTEGSLRDGKASGAAMVIDGLEDAGLPPELGEEKVVIDIELDEDAALVWLKTFTDLRLALATRLEVEQDDEEFWALLPDDDPRSQAHDIYEWIGALQETLVDSLR